MSSKDLRQESLENSLKIPKETSQLGERGFTDI